MTAILRRLRGLGYATIRAARALRNRPLAVAFAVSAVAVALVLVGAARLAEHNVDRVTDRWQGGVQMVVYLEDGADRSLADAITGVLTDLPAVDSVHYVPSDEALERLRTAFGDRDEVLQGMAGMLPASLEVTLARGVRDVAAAHPVVARLEATAGVEEVELVGDWVDRATSLIGGLRSAATALFLIIAIAGLFVVAATMRVGTPPRQREAQLVALVGGTPRFTRAPMLIEGAVQGLVGGLCAVAALWVIYTTGAASIESTLSTAFGDVSLTFLPSWELFALAACGVAMGTLGALLAPGYHRHA